MSDYCVNYICMNFLNSQLGFTTSDGLYQSVKGSSVFITREATQW